MLLHCHLGGRIGTGLSNCGLPLLRCRHRRLGLFRLLLPKLRRWDLARSRFGGWLRVRLGVVLLHCHLGGRIGTGLSRLGLFRLLLPKLRRFGDGERLCSSRGPFTAYQFFHACWVVDSSSALLFATCQFCAFLLFCCIFFWHFSALFFIPCIFSFAQRRRRRTTRRRRSR